MRKNKKWVQYVKNIYIYFFLVSKHGFDLETLTIITIIIITYCIFQNYFLIYLWSQTNRTFPRAQYGRRTFRSICKPRFSNSIDAILCKCRIFLWRRVICGKGNAITETCNVTHRRLTIFKKRTCGTADLEMTYCVA